MIKQIYRNPSFFSIHLYQQIAGIHFSLNQMFKSVTMATSKKLKLKLMVDKVLKKVLFAESDKDFVDILLSFLTMPLGSIVRILNKQSSIGCMDKLYESIQNLDERYFSTETCKEMLLRPLNACRKQCEDLILRIDESNPRTLFKCNDCLIVDYPYFSLVPTSRCMRGHIMNSAWNVEKKEHRGPNGDGVFLRAVNNFIISDDLVIMPASTMNMHNLIEKHGIKDLNGIEETCIDMDAIMLLDLLKRSLVSKFPLSGMYFQKTDSTQNPQSIPKVPKIEDNLSDKVKKVKAKILICKSSNKILYAEAGEGFVDLLCSILTIPLGTIVKLLNKFSSIGCSDNLYKSVENLCSDYKRLKPDASDLLLHPKLAAHFNHSNSLFNVSEEIIFKPFFPDCTVCIKSKQISATSFCKHGVPCKPVTQLNPKLESSAEVGGSYAKMGVEFLITDDLQIKPFSTMCSMRTIKQCQATFATLEEKEIDIDELVALKLLKSCLTSRTPLSDVFLTKKQRN